MLWLRPHISISLSVLTDVLVWVSKEIRAQDQATLTPKSGLFWALILGRGPEPVRETGHRGKLKVLGVVKPDTTGDPLNSAGPIGR